MTSPTYAHTLPFAAAAAAAATWRWCKLLLPFAMTLHLLSSTFAKPALVTHHAYLLGPTKRSRAAPTSTVTPANLTMEGALNRTQLDVAALRSVASRAQQRTVLSSLEKSHLNTLSSPHLERIRQQLHAHLPVRTLLTQDCCYLLNPFPPLPFPCMPTACEASSGSEAAACIQHSV